MKDKPPKKAKQLKTKVPEPIDYSLEPTPPDYFLVKSNKFNWVVVIWVGLIIILCAAILHWLIKLSTDDLTATATPDQYVIQIPLEEPQRRPSPE